MLESSIKAGQRSYRLFLTTSLFALVAALECSIAVKLDGYHVLAVLTVLALMACSAWVAGASVDKRIAKVTNAFWSQGKRDEIRSKLFAETAPGGEGGNRASRERLVTDVGHERSGLLGASRVAENKATAQ